jgi:hypothetical protein
MHLKPIIWIARIDLTFLLFLLWKLILFSFQGEKNLSNYDSINEHNYFRLKLVELLKALLLLLLLRMWWQWEKERNTIYPFFVHAHTHTHEHIKHYPHLTDRWCVTKCIILLTRSYSLVKSAIVFKLLSLKLILSEMPLTLFFLRMFPTYKR